MYNSENGYLANTGIFLKIPIKLADLWSKLYSVFINSSLLFILIISCLMREINGNP
jgi:hypothetical protein